MKYLKLFNKLRNKFTPEHWNKLSIDSLCEEYKIKNYTIRNDEFVDVDGDVNLQNRLLRNLPIKFGKVDGKFDCSFNQLTSLEGGPEISDYFRCNSNHLSSLEGCPKYVGTNFRCNSNHLSSLEGCPKLVFGDFWCYDNKLTSLKSAPEEIWGIFHCSNNHLSSLEGCPKRVNGFFCPYNELTIIDYLPEWIEYDIFFGYNQIRDIKVEDKNYRFYGKCNLEGNPIDDLFQYWEGDLKNFILDLDLEDFIRDDGKSVDMLRFEYALNGREYKEEDITNYKLIYKE